MNIRFQYFILKSQLNKFEIFVFNNMQNIVRDQVDKWTNGYKGSTLTSSLSKSHQIARPSKHDYKYLINH